MEPARANFRIYQGSTFNQIFRWETATKAYANIVGISKAAPCVIQVANGSITPPPSWRVRITGVVGMKEVNNPTDDSYYISTNSVGTNVFINEIDSTNFTAYTSGGILSWNYPTDLSIYPSAKLQIRKTLSSNTVELELTTANGGIIIDNTDKNIRIKITSTQTSALDFITAVYSLELTDVDANNLTFVTGTLTLVKEVVR
jgi:hypothetical protein